LLLYWFGSLGGAGVVESPSMPVDRGHPEPTQGRLPRYSARDGIGILVLSAHAEVELDVAFHVLRRFSAGAGAVQKVLEVPPASCAHDTFGQSWGWKKRKYQDFLSWRGVLQSLQ
jgi:hypothetical protein